MHVLLRGSCLLLFVIFLKVESDGQVDRGGMGTSPSFAGSNCHVLTDCAALSSSAGYPELVCVLTFSTSPPVPMVIRNTTVPSQPSLRATCGYRGRSDLISLAGFFSRTGSGSGSGSGCETLIPYSSRLNLTGRSTFVAMGNSPSFAGANRHVLTDCAALSSSAGCPELVCVLTFSTSPPVPTMIRNTTTPSQPCVRATCGYGGRSDLISLTGFRSPLRSAMESRTIS